VVQQILHELDRIQADLGGEVLEDEYLGRIVHRLTASSRSSSS
jgi:hypothetical protein